MSNGLNAFALGYYVNDNTFLSMLNHIRGPLDGLSDREIQLIKLSCSELTNAEIAGKLEVSPRTIDNIRNSLFQRFGISSRIGLVKFGIKNNLVDLDSF